jgi:2-methylcitrate dehydratase
VHVEPVSQWKGFSSGMTGMRAVYAASLAKRGFTGPRGLFEGPKGLEQMFAQSIPVDWEDPSLDFITQTVMKKYCSLIHGQPVLEAVLDLKRSSGLVAAEVEHVRCDIFQAGFDFAGGGSYGSKDHPWTKEQGDYNLKYLISAALLDGQVGPAQLEAARIQAPDAQAMAARVEVRPDEQLTARFPQELCARITVRTKDQRLLVKEHLGYEGGLDNPMSWDRTVAKFHWLSEAFADRDLRGRLIQAVQQLDTAPLTDLMDLLAQCDRPQSFPRLTPAFSDCSGSPISLGHAPSAGYGEAGRSIVASGRRVPVRRGPWRRAPVGCAGSGSRRVKRSSSTTATAPQRAMHNPQ